MVNKNLGLYHIVEVVFGHWLTIKKDQWIWNSVLSSEISDMYGPSAAILTGFLQKILDYRMDFCLRICP